MLLLPMTAGCIVLSYTNQNITVVTRADSSGTTFAFTSHMAVVAKAQIRFAKKPIAAALKSRKTAILRGMEEAAQMKNEAVERLADYEQKLATVDQEIERVREDIPVLVLLSRRRCPGCGKCWRSTR